MPDLPFHVSVSTEDIALAERLLKDAPVAPDPSKSVTEQIEAEAEKEHPTADFAAILKQPDEHNLI